MITEKQLELLKQYKDKSYINSLLAEQSYNYFNWIKNATNIPLIIVNSAMVCINSILTDTELLKILNIILNSSTGLVLSMISNFQIHESIGQFKDLHIKYTKLSHKIENRITNDTDNITTEYINSIIEDYDNIDETIKYTYPNKIKKRIKKEYEGKMSLPLSLSTDIVSICDSDRRCCNNI
jgi:hypothetical protein